MIFDDDTDDFMEELEIARRMLSCKDQLTLANEFIEATISEEMSQGGFENPTLCNLDGLRDALKLKGYAVSLELGRDEPIITIRKRGRRPR